MLTQVLHEATYCILIRYTCKFCTRTSVCHMSSDLPMQLQTRTTCKKNRRSVRVKRFAIRSWADEGWLISFWKYSSSNFSHVRPSWLLNSNLFTSAFCCFAQFRRFLDTPRCSFFRQFSSFFIVSKPIHQEGAVFLVKPFTRGSILICCPTLWC